VSQFLLMMGMMLLLLGRLVHTAMNSLDRSCEV